MDYLRNGTTADSNPLEMDDMRYEYYANTNKLRRVHDAVASGNYAVFIDQQTNDNSYKYDNIGNLRLRRSFFKLSGVLKPPCVVFASGSKTGE